MSKLYLLLRLMFLGILYLAIPYSDEIYAFYPMSDMEVSFQNYAWYALNKIAFMAFAWIILNESDRYKFALWVFFGVQVLKFFDYLLCYNEIWLRIWSVPFSSNTLGFFAFLLAVGYEYAWEYGSRS